MLDSDDDDDKCYDCDCLLGKYSFNGLCYDCEENKQRDELCKVCGKWICGGEHDETNGFCYDCEDENLCIE